MKGCLAVIGVLAVIVLLLGGGCFGYAVYQGNEMEKEVEAGKRQLDAVDAKFPFAPSAEARLEPERFGRFVKIRGSMVERTKRVFDDLKAIGKKPDAGFFETMKEAFSAMKGMAKAFTGAPAELAALLEQGQMSFKEYRWSTSRMHGTLLAAARAGNAEAAALNDTFEDSTRDVMQHGDTGDQFERMRADLAAAYPSFDAAELALILSMKDALLPEAPGLLVDQLVLDDMDSSGAP